MPACWHCHHYAGLDATRRHAVCHQGSRVYIQARPETGCAFWEREPGSDDGGAPADFRGISEAPGVWRPSVAPAR